jgi:hypothetical protein
VLGLVGAGLNPAKAKATRRGAELFGTVLEGLAALGLISGAAIVSIYGNFLLGGVFAFFGLLMLARFKRGRVKSK